MGGTLPPDEEGFLGIVNLLTRAMEALLSEDLREAEILIMKAKKKVLKLAKVSVDDVHTGMELGKLLGDLKHKGI